MKRILIGCVAAALLSGCATVESVRAPVSPGSPVSERRDSELRNLPTPNAEQLMADLSTLAADDMEGRRIGSAGGVRARDYIVARFAEIGVPAPRGEPFDGRYRQAFSYDSERYGARLDGSNVVGVIAGDDPSRTIVITAHYDHEGVIDGAIYNGADDNASGVAALLAVAEAFVADPPRHTLVLAALDAEEDGHVGVTTLLANPPVVYATIALNVNLDMVSQSDRDELYVAGASHAPWLAPWLEWIAHEAPVTLLQGHDSPAAGEDQDWTTESDHEAFFAAGIPFVYFGVEDHAHYHQPSDDADTIPVEFFTRSVATILMAVRRFDAELDAIELARAEAEAATGAGAQASGGTP